MQSPGRKEDMLDPIAELFRRVGQLEHTRFNTVEETDVTAHAALFLGVHGVPSVMGIGQGLIWNGSDWDAAAYALVSDLNTLAFAAVLDGDPAGGVLNGTYPNPGFASNPAFTGTLSTTVDLSATGVFRATVGRGRTGIAGSAGAGLIEIWDRISVSSAHAFQAFSDPGAGGAYLNGLLRLQDVVLRRESAGIMAVRNVTNSAYAQLYASSIRAAPGVNATDLYDGRLETARPDGLYLQFGEPSGLVHINPAAGGVAALLMGVGGSDDVMLKRETSGLLVVRNAADSAYMAFKASALTALTTLNPPDKTISAGVAGELFYDSTTGRHSVRDGVASADKKLLREGDVAGAVPAAARAYRSAAYSLPDSAWTKIPLDAIENSLDNDAMWDSANNRFVIKTAGIYVLAGNIKTGSGTGTGAYRVVAVVVNGAIRALQRDAPVGAGNMLNCATGAISLSAGDTVELWGFQSQGSALALALTDTSAGSSGNVVWLSAVRVSPYDSRAKSIIPTEESRTNTAYGPLATLDQATVNLPPDGLLIVSFKAMWKETVAGAARAAIFIDGNQLKNIRSAGTAPSVEAGAVRQPSGAFYTHLFSHPMGLVSSQGSSADGTEVTTGQTIAGATTFEFAGSVLDQTLEGGHCIIDNLPAGSHTVSIQYKASSGTVWVKDRRLRVEAKGF